ncbi:MAG: DNA polymerase III subunit gamma/tau [Tissierellaceae bacterium]|nr:DNA polymerase III subunit gamma/tau [Tissierellaceae bacterium]
MYQAIYRQYRPKTFDEILGQKHVTNILKNQIKNKNIGHAYLFSGTRGTGKTSAAKIFSRAVNCLNPVDGNPCNQCEICKGIQNESIIDIIEMDAASNRRIDDIRELRDKVVYLPSRTKYKVYIIDEVHMLTTEAFNALLKTLEEPPKHLIFILATTEPQKLPQTILSRCQRFDFKRITKKDIIENMKSIIKDLNVKVDDRALNLIAGNVDGAMRDALSLLDQCLSYGGDEITYEDAIDILGVVNMDIILDIVDSIIEKNIEDALETIDKVIENGKDINQFIKDLIYHYRNLMIVKTTKDPNALIEVDEDLIKRYTNQSENTDTSRILKSLDILTAADEKAKWSSGARVILEMAVIELIRLDELLSLEERVKKLEQGIVIDKRAPAEPIKKVTVEERSKEVPKPPEKQMNEVEEEHIDSGEELSFQTISGDWTNILQTIKTQKMNIYALLIEGEPVSFSNNLITIGYKEGFGFHKEAVSSPQNKEFVEKVISGYYKRNIEVAFAMASEKQKLKEEKIDKDKLIKEAIDFFGENIVEIK